MQSSIFSMLQGHYQKSRSIWTSTLVWIKYGCSFCIYLLSSHNYKPQPQPQIPPNFSLIMSIFYHEEPPPNSPKRCKFLAATLKDAFSNCHSFGGRRSTSSLEEESATSDFDDDQEVLTINISAYVVSTFFFLCFLSPTNLRVLGLLLSCLIFSSGSCFSH